MPRRLGKNKQMTETVNDLNMEIEAIKKMLIKENLEMINLGMQQCTLSSLRTGGGVGE